LAVPEKEGFRRQVSLIGGQAMKLRLAMQREAIGAAFGPRAALISP